LELVVAGGNFDATRVLPPLSAFSDAATGARLENASPSGTPNSGVEFDKLPVLAPQNVGPADLSWLLTASNIQNLRNTPLSAQYAAPYYTPFDDEGSADERDDLGSRKSRLARKAELARASRRRKKFYVQNLETKVKTLTKTVEQLQQLKVPEAFEGSNIAMNEMLRKNVEEMVACVSKHPKNGEPNDEDLGRSIKAYIAPLSLRASQNDALLLRVQNSMNLNTYMKPHLWGLASTAALDADESSWGERLVHHLGLSEWQVGQLTHHRATLMRLREQVHASEASLQDLRRQFESQQRTIDQHTDLLESVLTPVQLANYYLFEELRKKEAFGTRV
jgi:hypothetical protein